MSRKLHQLQGGDDVETAPDTKNYSTHSDSGSEQPKVALRKGISLKFCLHLTGHLLSLVFTGSILQLSWRNVYRSDDAVWDKRWYMLNLGRNGEANLLQFLAKLHELVMVASLYAIILHFSRRLLVSSAGVPFGLLLGGYQPPSRYIVHKSLWAPLLKYLRRRCWPVAIFAAGLLFATIFANTLGPASAIALIPNLGWYTMSHPLQNISTQTMTSLGARPNASSEVTMRSFYPAVLDRFAFDNIWHFNECHVHDSRKSSPDCPGKNWEVIHQWATTFSISGLSQNPLARSGTSTQVNANSFLASSLFRANHSAIAVATQVPNFIVQLMDDFWNLITLSGIRKTVPARQRFSTSTNSPVFAPIVRTQCRAYDLEPARAENTPLYFPTSWLDNPASPVPSDNQWSVPRNTWDDDWRIDNYPHGPVRHSWVPVPDDGRRIHEGASVGIVLRLPYVTFSGQVDKTSAGIQHSVVMPCVISAYWEKPEVTLDPSTNFRVESSFTETGVLERFTEPRLSGSAVRMEPEWADLAFIKPWERKRNATGSEGFVEADQPYSLLRRYVEVFMAEYATGNDSGSGPAHHFDFGFRSKKKGTEDRLANNASSMCEPMSMILSLALAEGMATVGRRSATNAVVLTSNNSTDRTVAELSRSIISFKEEGIFHMGQSKSYPHSLNVSFQFERYGWGYGLQAAESGTLIYAFVVLVLHSVLVLVYLIYLAWFRCSAGGYLSSAWDDLGDLLALALASKEATLGHVGAGVESSATWTRRVVVRPQSSSEDKTDTLGLIVEPDFDDAVGTQTLELGKKYG